MATLTPVQASRDGAAYVPASAAGGGDEFANDGNTLILVENGSGGSITVTIPTQATADGGLAIADRAVAVAAGAKKVIGPFPTGIYNDGDGNCQLTYSGVTSLTVSVIKQG